MNVILALMLWTLMNVLNVLLKWMDAYRPLNFKLFNFLRIPTTVGRVLTLGFKFAINFQKSPKNSWKLQKKFPQKNPKMAQKHKKKLENTPKKSKNGPKT